MNKTNRTQYEIELSLANYKDFDFRKNIIAYNVLGENSLLPIFHECDMLVLSKSGYLTEIEIKRSWSDFLADFKKDHSHEGRGLIKYFYYCIPECMLNDAYDVLQKNNRQYTGIITYNEELKIKLNPARFDLFSPPSFGFRNMGGRKLFLEEQLQVARYGSMRAVMLRQKVVNMEKQI